MTFSNGLTKCETERLVMLAEEAGEIVQAVGKTLRHGYYSRHPMGSENNKAMLERELRDLKMVVAMMEKSNDISSSVVKLPRRGGVGWRKKFKYTHHQRLIRPWFCKTDGEDENGY